MKTTKPRLSRRNFLLAVSAGSVAGAAVTIAKKESDASAASGKGKDSTTGYQVTDHVRNYYRTAKI